MTNFQDRQYEVIYRMLWAGEVVPYKELLPSAKKRVDTAQSQLNNLIKDSLPKENTSELKNGAFISGYNQAIADVRKALGINDV